ncbi:MAG: CRISPR-associated protein Cas4 [Thermosphaera sp.]|uniref:CRISPR-associated protein Cas4 n=1 Tax=Thermofilum sp. TaxID=1961369 RepID=UPI003169BD4C
MAKELRPPINVVISVSDVVTCCICPRLLFIKKYLGLLPQPTESMIKGSLAHKVYLDFSVKIGKAIEAGSDIHREAQIYLEGWANELSKGLISQVDYDLIEEVVNFRLRNRPHTPISVETKISSVKLGVSGVIDMIEGTTPVEVKLKSRPRLQDYIQLTWYAILMEEELGVEVEYGYLDLVPIMRLRVHVSDKLKDLALSIRDEAIRVLYSLDEAPRRVEKPTCRSCELNLECKLLG